MPIELQSLPHDVKVHRLVKTFNYKTNVHGVINKARLSFRVNRLRPSVDFIKRDLAVNSADRAAVRLVMAREAQNGMLLKQIDISSAFSNETFQCEKQNYFERAPNFDGKKNGPSVVYRVAWNISGT